MGSNSTPEEVVQAHLRKAKRFLQAAKSLLEDDFYEDSVNRAYYAMFHAAKACLAKEDLFPKTHAGVVSEFGRVFVLKDEADEKLGKSLSEAKEEREDSDYEAFVEVEEKEAEKILNDARNFLKESEKIIEKTKKSGK
ncbi:hypothetical protein AKJ57_06875 [candidate division MSBL1 archaeon SCGC-AAA259A05]|uniref:HEPN domain-containing protein n=1 Tax=candidate division MSBL1 archaeon SCGC-AAA259A05 TaxID=1698259 RepID=A0A133U2S1_9EURY|nr:hypothetical protein AKJ57_06875 [candidate division MSBL1 archaeon SCGC-AAA259A05]